MNATRVLAGQHRAVELLFEETSRPGRASARSRAVSHLAEELIAHLAAEESVFYPAVKRVLRRDRTMAERLYESRLHLRAELRRVLGTPASDAALPERVASLRSVFARHVRDEETELFPRATTTLGAKELEALGAEVLSSRPAVWLVTTDRDPSLASAARWTPGTGVSLPMPSRG